MLPLPTLPGGGYSIAYGASDDGTVVVGWSSPGVHAVRWKAGGILDLGLLPGGGYSQAWGVSGDGLTVVGQGSSFAGDRAFRWRDGRMDDLGTLPGGVRSFAYGVSGDGSVIVGHDEPGSCADGARAFRWTEMGGMRDLGKFPHAVAATALGVSDDGRVVVGYGVLPKVRRYRTGCIEESGPQRAFVWTSSLGMVDLNKYLRLLGANLTGWTLRQATGASADGTVIVGGGDFQGQERAWIVTGLWLP
jgi:probable HAF family extracellular repeat protein